MVTLTDSVFCGFQRNALWELHRQSPAMGFNITWLTAHEESLVDDTLLSVGRRSAEEHIATLLIQLYKRAAALHAEGGWSGVPFPLTQQHIAAGLGLSLVHSNKTLRNLTRVGCLLHCKCENISGPPDEPVRVGRAAPTHCHRPFFP